MALHGSSYEPRPILPQPLEERLKGSFRQLAGLALAALTALDAAFAADDEGFHVVLLDVRGRLLRAVQVAEGSLSQCPVSPRDACRWPHPIAGLPLRSSATRGTARSHWLRAGWAERRRC